MGSLLRRALILADVYKIFVGIVILLPQGKGGPEGALVQRNPENDVCKSPKTKHGFKLKNIFEYEMAYNAPGLGCIQVFQTLFRLARSYEITDS